MANENYVVSLGVLVVPDPTKSDPKRTKELKAGDQVVVGKHISEDEVEGLVARNVIMTAADFSKSGAGAAVSLQALRDQLAGETARADTAEAQVADLQKQLAAAKPSATAPT